METIKKTMRKLRNRRLEELRSDGENSTGSSEQSVSLERKANPDRTSKKRQGVSEMVERCGSDTEGVITRSKRKVMDDSEGSSQQRKKVQKLDPLRQEESATSSVDNGTSTDPLKGCSAFVGGVSQTQLKRKSDVEAERPSKKLRKSLDLQETIPAEVQTESSTNPLEGCSALVSDATKTQVNRKPNGETERPSKKIKKSLNPQKKVPAEVQRAQFEAKYRQEEHLEDGGFGCVFAGYRIADELPVAIKHIPKDKVPCKLAGQNGQSVEVAVMLKLSDGTEGSVGTSTSVSLLDWYDLGHKLVLVLERPVPCEDLFTYIMTNGGPLPEEEAKVILTQLLDGVTELHNNQIFHRDIKIENILIETGSDVPRARLIDFGLSCFFKTHSVYRNFYGTVSHVPPEFVTRRAYRPGPTTVWQLGVVLYEMLHGDTRFETISFLREQQPISDELSKNCQDFLKMCLTKTPGTRPSLEELHLHPWLRETNVNTPPPDSRP